MKIKKKKKQFYKLKTKPNKYWNASQLTNFLRNLLLFFSGGITAPSGVSLITYRSSCRWQSSLQALLLSTESIWIISRLKWIKTVSDSLFSQILQAWPLPLVLQYSLFYQFWKGRKTWNTHSMSWDAECCRTGLERKIYFYYFYLILLI